MYKLRVSDNHRFLVHEDGEPFFYLGDTAWELFHRLDREDAALLLQDRAAKRFTVIQAVVLAEYEGLTVPNAYGHLPLLDNDPTRPNEAYFEHVDAIMAQAELLASPSGCCRRGVTSGTRNGVLAPDLHARKCPYLRSLAPVPGTLSAHHLDPRWRPARRERSARSRPRDGPGP